jgi:hypothetical protein
MLSDDQYDRIAPLLQRKSTDPGRTAGDNRLFVEAVLWAAHGAICRPISERGIVCTNALAGGLERKYGMRYSPSLRATPTFEEVFIDSTIVRAHQHAAGAAKKRRTGDRALAWRIEHQDSRSGRRLGYARPLSSDGRTGRRQSRSSALAGRAETRQSGCRQRLRYKPRSCNIWNRQAFKLSSPVAPIVLSNVLWMNICMPLEIWSNGSSVASNNPVAWLPATTSSPNDSHHLLRSPLLSSGPADCQQALAERIYLDVKHHKPTASPGAKTLASLFLGADYNDLS